MQTYNPDKELIKDFLRWVSDTHKCAIVQFPDEFAASAYVNYRFIDTVNLVEEFVNESQRKA